MTSARALILLLLGVALPLQACGGHGGQGRTLPPVHVGALETPNSISPASVHVPPMVQTKLLPPSAMTSIRLPRSAIQPLGWTQLSGGAIYVAASPDGSLWVLSSVGSGPDRAIWHYVNGNWTNIPGAAMRMSVAPNGTLWVVNSAGGIYAYNGSWSGIAGGASDITVGADGSVYVISNQGSGTYGRGIWRYSGGAWTQMPGAAVRIAASWDTGSYPGGIAPGGFWVTNANGGIFYYNPATGFNQIPGGVGQVAPTKSGGLFALGYLVNSDGSFPIYYNDLATGNWTQQPGAATSISTDGTHVYVTGAAGGIYSALVRTLISSNGTGLTGPNFGPCSGSGCDGGWGPTAVANALVLPVQSGFDGTSFTVAIVIDSNVNASDLSAYFAYFKTPQTSRRLTYTLIDGASATPKTGDGDLEATLDIETVAGLAPGANVMLYVVPALSMQHVIDAYNQILTDGNASIVSLSYGGCEASNWQNGQSVIFQRGAQNGVAFAASSGDWGNECYAGTDSGGANIYQQGVVYPASDPNVIGVGGSETVRPANLLTSATAWNDSFAFAGQEATGGGVSASFLLPSYQNGLSGTASTQYRNVPDIAMPAVDTAMYQNGSWTRAVGTSWSAPMFAAMLSEVYHYCSASFINPVTLPYYVYGTAGYNAFIDVTGGNNQYMGTGPAYSAHAGYDNTTGIGVPLGMPFANTVCPNRVPAARLRRPMAVSAPATLRPARAFEADVTPHVRGLIDRGRRSPVDQTRIQLVLQPTATLAADEQTVLSVLRSAGFTIERTFANHLVIDAQGPSASVEHLFATQLRSVVQGRFGTRYMPGSLVTIPSSLAPYIASVSLDDVVTMSRASHLRLDAVVHK